MSNFSTEEFKISLLQTIASNVRVHRVNNSQVAIRCPLCGDSKTDKTKKRFYIKVDIQNDDIPVMYNCFNCNESGILTPSILRNMDIHDLDLITSLRAYNKKVSRNNTTYNFKIERLDLKVPEPDETSGLNILKKEYIEGRIGRKFTFKELKKLKTVFSLGDLLIENNISKVNCSKEKALEIDQKYVDFLTINNEMLNCRQVVESSYKRYEKYAIDSTRVNQLKFYVVPTEVDTMSVEPITINIAEGVFDILGVYYNVHHGGLPHSIYAAICGANFRSVIEYFIKEGIVGDDVVLNIFKDNDQELDHYKDLKRDYAIWFKSFNVYSNTLGKDFGVTQDKIDIIRNRV